MEQPRDPATYRMAVAALGLSLALVLVGICLVLAFGSGAEGSGHTLSLHTHGFHSKRGSDRPAPTRRKITYHLDTASSGPSDAPTVPRALWAIAAALAGLLVGLLLPAPRAKSARRGDEPGGKEEWVPAFVLAGLLVVAVIVDCVTGSTEALALLAATGAGLATVLIPSPAQPDVP